MTTNSTLAMRRRQRRIGFQRAITIACATALICSFTGCSSSKDSDAQAAATTPGNVTLTAAQRPHIQLHTISASTYSKTIETTGSVDFDNDRATSVLAPISGPVSRILVAPGEKVAKGQALAFVDSPDFAAATSTYSKTVVAATNARKIADVDKDLFAHDGVSQRENQQAQTDAVAAEADRDAALQALNGLGVDANTIKSLAAGKAVSHSEGVIRAPIAGTVAEKLISPGQLLQAGSTPCFTVADLSQVWVMAQLSGTELAAVKVGDSADVLVDGTAKPLAGTVANISAVVDPDTRAVTARIDVANPGDVLKKQMYVSVRIHSQTQDSGILAPVSAILRDDENLPFVYALQADGSFARQSITLGDQIGDQYVVPSGLKAGDQIVVNGGIFMQFMQ
ncbi:MAG: efflux RND transporter periplasmic adaptor subunit, partial [Lysobacteraceae bacterium]